MTPTPCVSEGPTGLSRFAGLQCYPRLAQLLNRKRACRDSLGHGPQLVVLHSLRGLTTLSLLDSHTLQGMQGCDLGPDGRLLRWYNQLAYDGEDFLTLNEDLNSQTMTTSTIAQISQHKLEAHLKAGNCMELLQKHLEKGKDTLLRSGALGSHTLPVSLKLLAECLESWGRVGGMRGLGAELTG